jgi:hypothetical protein
MHIAPVYGLEKGLTASIVYGFFTCFINLSRKEK